ncbi:MAG: hypothetical protein VW600_13580 [Ferrovibrio sp.]
MSSYLRAAAFALLAVFLPPAVFAADRIPHPADPDAAVPATAYQSTFAGYHKAGFSEKRDWRAANDALRDAGGHAGAVQGEDAPAPSPHAGHQMPMQMPMKMPMSKPGSNPGQMPMMPGHHHGHHAMPEKQP